MDRRKFLRRALPVAGMIPGVLDGFPIRAFATGNKLLDAAMLPYTDTDKILVIVQLSGGNDGLNTVIPISSYRDYENARKNIAIPEAKILRLDGLNTTGLH